MYETTYHKPASVADAAAALAGAEDGRVLAGGQTLLPTMKQRLAAPSDLVDIRSIDGMVGVTVDGDTVTIGAATTHAAVASDAGLQGAIPGLAALAGGIGDPAVRAMGTIGGSVANNDPAADYPAAMLALGATIVTNKREIAAEDFFDGMFSTALDDGEIVTALRIPVPKASAYAKFRNPASRYAIVGVCVVDTGSGMRVAVTGAGQDGVFRHSGLEDALSSGTGVDGVSVDADALMSDMHATAEYRANLVRVMAGRAAASMT